jgi:DeoR/GlpR family transcriptional regulator of sugar metabolism
LASLDERGRRLFAGLLARQRGHGGVVALARITGLSRTTIRRGLVEVEQDGTPAASRVRRPGGGRKRAEKKTPI